MGLPGVPDDHLERLHWREGGGRASLGYWHRPSGITVRSRCPPGVSLHALDVELLAQLGEKLRAEGLLAGTGESA